MTLPPLQDISISGRGGRGLPIHRALYKQREKSSRGANHVVPESTINTGQPVGGALQAIVAQSAATVISQMGNPSLGGPRIVIPIPAVLVTVTAIASGMPGALPAGQPQDTAAPMPSLQLDSEWFFPQAYPQEIRQYLVSNYSFDLRPQNSVDILEKTQTFLRQAYKRLPNVGLIFKMSSGFKTMFDELTAENNNIPKHPYTESDMVRNGYMILAYVMSTVLWNAGAASSIRQYSEPTYPGVIMASYVARLTGYYNDISKVLGLSPDKPFLRRGILGQPTDSANIRSQGGIIGKEIKPLSPAVINIPSITSEMMLLAQFATKRKTDPKECIDNPALYPALKEGALNVKGLDLNVAKTTIDLEAPPSTVDKALREQILTTRCTYFIGLITGSIKPSDTLLASPGLPAGLKSAT